MALSDAVDASLTVTEGEFIGYGKQTLLAVDPIQGDRCDLEFGISLKLSADLQYLTGTRNNLKWSGRKKDSCKVLLDRPPAVQFRRK